MTGIDDSKSDLIVSYMSVSARLERWLRGLARAPGGPSTAVTAHNCLQLQRTQHSLLVPTGTVHIWHIYIHVGDSHLHRIIVNPF